MTGNRQLLEELMRGGVATASALLGAYMLQMQPIIALFLFILAAIAIRGCAFCYFYGLFGAAKACAIRPKQAPQIKPE